LVRVTHTRRGDGTIYTQVTAPGEITVIQ